VQQGGGAVGGGLFDQDVSEAGGADEFGLLAGKGGGGNGATQDDGGVPVRAAGCAGAGWEVGGS
jgi:hypothetical protein